MKRWIFVLASLLFAGSLAAQTCTPGGGVTCTTNLNMWVVPYGYSTWNVPANANTNLLDTFAGTVVLKSGSTMTGPLILSANPTVALGAATKQYVDSVSGISGITAPAGSWPTWLVPTVTSGTQLTVAASPIPNTALQNSTLTLGSSTLTLGAVTSSVTGLTIDGVTPTTMGFVDATSSIQTQLNAKAAKGANGDITSLSGLTTPLSVPQGGTGVATGTGYAYGNGAGAFTFSTTIPYSALTGVPVTGVSSVFGRTGAVAAQTNDYSVSQITGAAPSASPTFTGTVTMPFVTAGLVKTDALGVISSSGLSLTGSGAAVPTSTNTSVSGDIVTFTGTVGQMADSGTLLTSLAPLNSPALTGTPTAPTAAVGTNTTQIATAALVNSSLPVNKFCGTSTTCSNTTVANPLKWFWGTVPLSGGTATITGFSPAFVNTTTPQCTCEDTTAPLNACAASLASTSSVSLVGNLTDTVGYVCWGP